jgi:hypothetical protein
MSAAVSASRASASSLSAPARDEIVDLCRLISGAFEQRCCRGGAAATVAVHEHGLSFGTSSSRTRRRVCAMLSAHGLVNTLLRTTSQIGSFFSTYEPTIELNW